MQWDKDLLDDQKKAASHIGDHARLLAGPGTGKTLTLTPYRYTSPNGFYICIILFSLEVEI